MAASAEVYEKLIRSAARRLKGHQRRLFQAAVADALCNGSPRAAERRFGFDRHAVTTGQHEARSGIRCVEDFAARARSRTPNWPRTSAPSSSPTPRPTPRSSPPAATPTYPPGKSCRR